MSEMNNELMKMLLGNITEQAQEIAKKEIESLKESLQKEIKDIEKETRGFKKKIEEKLAKHPTTITLGTIEKPVLETTHKAFDKIAKVLSSSKRKEKNIMLVGQAGSGKTHLVRQIAEALRLPFYPMSVGLQTTKSDLLGFINATGQYMPTCIRHAYESGGVLLLDEFDSAHAGVVTILNSLLANGHCSFPDRVVDKHKDFICICACNTYGKGGNIDYVGRNRLDAATLDRFIVIDVDYDEGLEKTLTNHKEWTDAISKVRSVIETKGLKMIVSPRASMDGADLMDAGFTLHEALEMCVLKGCDGDCRHKILSRFPSPSATTTGSKGVDIYIDLDSNTYGITFYTADLAEDFFTGDRACISLSGGYEIRIAKDTDTYSTYIDSDGYIWLNNCEPGTKFSSSHTKVDKEEVRRKIINTTQKYNASYPVVIHYIYQGEETIKDLTKEA